MVLVVHKARTSIPFGVLKPTIPSYRLEVSSTERMTVLCGIVQWADVHKSGTQVTLTHKGLKMRLCLQQNHMTPMLTSSRQLTTAVHRVTGDRDRPQMPCVTIVIP